MLSGIGLHRCESRLDFTSALYLGFSHSSESLPNWSSLTTGRPAALRPAPLLAPLEAAVARLAGTEAACIGTSTLHFYNDLIGGLIRPGQRLLIDAGCYPIAQWSAERASGRGSRVRHFRHYDPDALARVISARGPGDRGAPALILTDALCTECGRIAPLPDYLRIARDLGAHLVVDDTQALGILGEPRGFACAYGSGGGGSLRWHGLTGEPHCILISSMAKAFGAPLAVLCGESRLVEQFRSHGETLVHCSPPAQPILLAAQHALWLNGQIGEQRRRGLIGLTVRLRQGLARMGLALNAGLLPIQPLDGLDPAEVVILHRRLKKRGIETLLSAGRPAVPNGAPGPRLTVVLTAIHTANAVDRLLREVHAARIVRTACDDAGPSAWACVSPRGRGIRALVPMTAVNPTSPTV